MMDIAVAESVPHRKIEYADYETVINNPLIQRFEVDNDYNLGNNTVLSRDYVYSNESVYVDLFQKYPSSVVIKVPQSKLDEFLQFLLDENYKIFSIGHENRHKTTDTLNFIKKESKSFIHFYCTAEKIYDSEEDQKTFTITCLYDPLKLNYFKDLKTKFSKPKEKEGNIYLLQKDTYGELYLQPYNVSGYALNIEENYADGFNEVNENILDWMDDFSMKNRRMVLLHGEPGSGKTNYIEYLLNQVSSVRKIYIPPCFVEVLGDPAFLTFIKTYKNSVLIVEDAEKVLTSRERDETNSAMSLLLNLSDGIMGAILNFKFICTFNTDEENIDSALKRKGRLFLKYKFNALSKEKTSKLYNKLYGKNPPEERMTLASIYNEEDNGEKKKEERKMGFL